MSPGYTASLYESCVVRSGYESGMTSLTSARLCCGEGYAVALQTQTRKTINNSRRFSLSPDKRYLHARSVQALVTYFSDKNRTA